ncbi:MAG: sulfatase-like hydrolase/transferase [Acidobacteria bacterium]|nr:sulfatase-like hydrolase/transferase [Acidobacteriota bacterium]MYA45355.1 sulfatase-like hydrolase/transferase [Acidobacteriota bacterium]
MTGEAPHSERGSWLRAALVLVGLNLFLTISFSSAAPWVRPTAAVSPDLLVLVGAGALLGGRWSPRWLRVLLALTLLVAASARIAGLIALELLGRPLDPAGDLPHLGNVAEMLATVSPVLTPAVLVPLGGLLLGGLLLLIVRALGILAEAAARLGRRRRAGFAAAAFVLLALPWLSPPGGSALLAARDLAAAPAAEPPASITDPPLPGAPDLAGADFYVIFLESYGVAAFQDPGRRAALEAAAARWAEDAQAGGFDYRSAQVQSPTFGGGSWRAHASLLSGVWVEREALYRALIGSGRASLVRLLGEAGYRTVAFEPGIQGEWPEGAWYGFDRIYDREGIGYRGPAMGWWEVPDQYTLYALHQREIRTADRPLFAKVSLIMSHIPYWPVPPYVTPWSRFDAGTAYEGPLRSIAHDDYRDLAELSERYVTSLEYQFRVVGGFLREFAPRPALVAVIGDHQPPKLSLHDSDTWATPMHLFARDPQLLEPWEQRGFTRTLIPETGTSWRMSDFPHDLTEFFPDRSAAGAVP